MDISQSTLDYIREHAGDDIRRLAFQSVPEGIDKPFVLNQIACRQKARRKLPSWAACEALVYPPSLSLEQCSSETTALYKASLLERVLPSRDGGCFRMADLTGGFGVDFSMMARSLAASPMLSGMERQFFYVERQEVLCGCARHNFPLLGLTDVEVVCDDAEHFISGCPSLDVVFFDPARRDAAGQRTYDIHDCTPDATLLMPVLMGKARVVMVKLSPMLDWHKAVADVNASVAGQGSVSHVAIVSAAGECKEVLLVVQPCLDRPLPEAVLICTEGTAEVFRCPLSAADIAPRTAEIGVDNYSALVGQYLLEPSASLMKSGMFGALQRHYGVRSISANSHLFVSSSARPDFPGRRFVIDAVTTLNKRELKEAFRGITQANITVRNFPLSAVELRKRLKVKDGGVTYVMATTLADGTHCLLLCSKV